MSLKLLKDLNFAEKLNNVEAVTEAGKEMLRNYRGYMYTNAASCGIVNGFIQEAKNFSFDAGLVSILESVLNFVNENKISWQLASACESITKNPSSYNYIAKLGVEQVSNLLQMNEAEVVSYIKAGALKNIQYIPEFRSICKQVYKSTVNEQVQGATYTVNTPVSFVVTEGENCYFKVMGKTFVKTNKTITESNYTDKNFERINALVESFKTVDNALVYEHTTNVLNPSKFTLTEDTINFTRGGVNESFDTVAKFMEYVNTLSVTMPIAEKMNFLQVCGAVSEVFEAMTNIVAVDCVKVMECSNGTVCAIAEGAEDVNLTVFRSYNAGTSSNNYQFMVEAVKEVTKLTGIDLTFMYENRIDEDCKKENPEEYKQIQEELAASKQAQIDIRKKKIAMLAEKYKNDPARIALLNKTANELALLENLK